MARTPRPTQMSTQKKQRREAIRKGWRRLLFFVSHRLLHFENARPTQIKIRDRRTNTLSRLPERMRTRGDGALGQQRMLDLRSHVQSAPLSLRQSQLKHAHRIATAPQRQSTAPAPTFDDAPTRTVAARSWRGKLTHLPASRSFSSSLILIAALVLVGGGLAYQSLTSSLSLVFAEALTGQDHLVLAESALRNADFDTAQSEFLAAQQNFEQAMNEIGGQYSLSAIPGINVRLDAGTKLMEIGHLIATSGYQLTTSLEPITDILRGGESSRMTGESSLTDYSAELMTTLSLGRPQLKLAKEQLEKAETLLSTINPDYLMGDYSGQLEDSQDKVAELVKILSQAYQLADILPGMLGDSQPKKYLILFQNNAELRPTGGFIGSYAVAKFVDGKLDNFFADNIYNPDGQIAVKGLCELPPPSLLKAGITDCFGMRDGNWSPDFPTSARTLADLYEQATNQTADGVIAITPDILRDLLTLTGPIYLHEWNEVVNADNVIPLVQYKVSVEFKDSANPKLFLIDLSSALFERIQSMKPDQWPRLLKLMQEGLGRKSVILYAFDTKAAKFMRDNGVDGAISSASGDYLNINNANVSGTKASQYLSQDYQLKTAILADGSIENQLTITYIHSGSWEWPGGLVKNYQRIYLPAGSRLIQSTDAALDVGKLSITDVFDEFDKTVFADYVVIVPSSTVALSYTYRLPFRLDPAAEMNYSLLVERQPGTSEIPFSQTLTYDSFRLDPLLASPTYLYQGEGQLQNSFSLATDVESKVQFSPHRVL